MLIDSHCHLDFSEFDTDREAIWQSCLEHEIGGLILPGIEPRQWPRLKALVEHFPNMYFSVGLHPWWLEKAEIDNADWQAYIQHPGCVAIGECGLDKTIETPMERQELVFAEQLEIAERYGLPVIVHSVRTHAEVLKAIKRVPGLKGVIHGFSGSYEQARAYWDQGFYLGVGGTITYERAKKTRTAFKKMPIDALVLETDAPSMPLSGAQGERNSPLQLLMVAQQLAQLRHTPLDELGAITTENAKRLFALG